jgi:hypothetical protein
MNVGTTELILAAVIVLAIGVHIRARQPRWQPEGWARDMGFALTARNEALVRSYITRTRTLRAVGGVAGLVAPIVYVAIAEREPPMPFDFGLFDALVGYLVGALVAELTVRRPRTEVPTASLVPREIADYLPSAVTTTMRASAAIALVLIPLFLWLPHRESDMARVEMLPAILATSMILVVLVSVELLQRLIVGRPQAAVSSDVLVADDAIRSASVHALAGAGIALELLIISVEIAGIGFVSDIQVLRWTLPWVGLACFGGSLGAWMRVTRPKDRHVASAPPGAGM